MKQSWDKQSGSKVVKEDVHEMEDTEAYFKKEFTEAIDRRESLAARKSKRFRSAFTTNQINYLENEFKKFPYIGTAHRKEVANALNIHERAVKIWFQNRRMKEKKDTGSKDQESDDQVGRKNVGFANDKLNNVVAVSSANDACYSLPQLIGAANTTFSNMNIKSDDMKVEPVAANVSEPLKMNYYNDISPVKEVGSINAPYTNHTPPPVLTNHPANYRSSAEFSIDLCKKYRNNFPVNDLDRNNYVEADVTKINSNELCSTPSPANNSHDVLPKIDLQTVPEDLSCKSTVSKQPESISPRNMDSTSPGYIPLYVNYPQPYLSAGNVLWKPVNVLPIMSTGVSAVNISSNQSGTLSVSQEQNLPKKKCSCDCHSELPTAQPLPENSPPNPQTQYVITALPLQNYPNFK